MKPDLASSLSPNEHLSGPGGEELSVFSRYVVWAGKPAAPAQRHAAGSRIATIETCGFELSP